MPESCIAPVTPAPHDLPGEVHFKQQQKEKAILDMCWGWAALGLARARGLCSRLSQRFLPVYSRA